MPLASTDTHAVAAYSGLVQEAARFVPPGSGAEEAGFAVFAESCLRPLLSPSTDVAAWLAAANRQADQVPVPVLAGRWIPYAFHPRTAEVSWCLPVGRAVQPFHDQYISHCRQHLVNALVSPRSSLGSLLEYARAQRDGMAPAGFIFHLSRCGSTLVSGCLAALDGYSVLSESALLTEILLVRDMPPADQKSLLRLCVQLQGGASRVVVKWNAWDLCHRGLIRQIWPSVPALLLTREPLEILASHVRSTGRHMSGDPTLAGVHGVFSGGEDAGPLGFSDREDAGPLGLRIAVLEVLMENMLCMCDDPRTFLLDYAALDEAAVFGVCRRFGVADPCAQGAAVRGKMARHSKNPDAVFQADSAEKRRWLPESQVAVITRALAATYAGLISNLDK